MKQFKRTLMLTVLLCGMLTFQNVTVYGQSLIHPDCNGLHYTEVQDKRCLQCLINKPKKEEQIKILKSDTSLYLGQIRQFKGQTEVLDASLKESQKKLNKANKKLKLSMNLNKFGIPFALGGGFLIGVLIIK